MNKKLKLKIIKIIVLIIIISMLVYVSLWYLIKKGYLKSFYLLYGPEGTGYGYGGYYGYDEEDPCFYEPGTPDPCGGS